jgi:FkbM family methyltransferase
MLGRWLSSRTRPAAAHGVMAVRDKLADARSLLRGKDGPTIIDGGAAGGATIRRMREVFPLAVIHAFEVLPARLEQLHRKYDADPRVHIHPVALGDAAGDLTFNVTANRDSSSALKPGEVSIARHGDAVAVTQTLTVRQVRLDDAIGADVAVDLLKLDLQGYELHALRGGEALLRRTTLVLCEVEFVPLYDGQPLFGDIAAHLRQRGFRLHNLYDLWTLENGQLTSGEALFVRDDHTSP